jgi:hypothetical protein
MGDLHRGLTMMSTTSNRHVEVRPSRDTRIAFVRGPREQVGALIAQNCNPSFTAGRRTRLVDVVQVRAKLAALLITEVEDDRIIEGEIPIFLKDTQRVSCLGQHTLQERPGIVRFRLVRRQMAEGCVSQCTVEAILVSEVEPATEGIPNVQEKPGQISRVSCPYQEVVPVPVAGWLPRKIRSDPDIGPCPLVKLLGVTKSPRLSDCCNLLRQTIEFIPDFPRG